MGHDEKLTEPVMVRCGDQEMEFLDKFIKDSGGKLSYGAAFRAFLHYFKADYENDGPAGCLMKMISRL